MREGEEGEEDSAVVPDMVEAGDAVSEYMLLLPLSSSSFTNERRSDTPPR